MAARMRYDREDDILMIWLTENAQVDHAEQVGQTIVHMNEDGKPILLEVLNAQEFVLELVKTAIMDTSVGLA